jgi:CubicO group peptidase (beta-lactamase class C family)
MLKLEHILVAGVVASGCAHAPNVSNAPASPSWKQYATVTDAGFSASMLDSLRSSADSSKVAALMVVYRGNVLVAWGDVERKFQLHSVRKSLVSALYGTALADNKIKLDATLGELGIDDVGKLTAQEKSARVRDLIAARSGVYLSGAYGGVEQAAERPARGTFAPGTHWFYNNWDFNLAGVLYERFVGESLYVSFARRIAEPIGMQDYAASDGELVFEPTSTNYPAHTFRMSTRDLARFGQLYLQKGQWGGRTVVPAAWVDESTKPTTRFTSADGFREGTGYGYMWWTYAPGAAGEQLRAINKRNVIVASGTGGQALFVIPEEDMVVVIRGDTDNGPGISGGRAWRLVDGILKARVGSSKTSIATVPVSSVAMASAKPAPAPTRVIPLDAAVREQYVGSYRVGGPEPARVFVHSNRLYGFMPGSGDGELLPIGKDEFVVRGQSGVRVKFNRTPDGLVGAMYAEINGRALTAQRIN